MKIIKSYLFKTGFLLTLLSVILFIQTSCSVKENNQGSQEIVDNNTVISDTNELIISKEDKENKEEEIILLNKSIEEVIQQLGKKDQEGNPLITNLYCADPTAVEYEGRLYVYGTNDNQQYEYDVDGNNSYDKIKSLIMISTEDMVNWTYHGTIEVGKIAPWIIASWAPSIVSRVESDGKTHFYLYFSNSGWGVGVLTATSPTGPWSDPLGTSLIDGNTKGIGKTTPFDPGVVIDDNGVGWLSFGGSESGEDDEKNYLPGGARIAKLGDDMISIDSDFVEIPAPYHFEANELNFINGTYVYTYCTNWTKRVAWDLNSMDIPPSACCMSYMTTTTPLESDSWVYRGNYFKNPGENGLDYSNNHSHLHKYKGNYYLFYHTLSLQKRYGVGGGFRNLCVDDIEVNEEKLVINMTYPTNIGVYQIENFNPFTQNFASTFANSGGIKYDKYDDDGNMFITSTEAGSWTLIRKVDFGDGSDNLSVTVKGAGFIEIRLDNIDSDPIGIINVSSNEWETINANLINKITERHDLYFIYSDENISAYTWNFNYTHE